MGLTKHMAHQFHVEHAHLKTFLAPPLLHPSINHVKLLTLTRVGQSYRSHVVCESVTTLPPVLFTPQLQLYHQDKIFEGTNKLTLLVLKSLV